MKSATVQEIKQELINRKSTELVNLCLRLAKFKKENKELLTYLLFDSSDEDNYVSEVKDEVDGLFKEINFSHLYFVKKSLRKILRIINKHSRYMNSKSAEAELRLYYCQLIADSGIPIEKNPVINNMYRGQYKKVEEVVNSMHEDLQYEYIKKLKQLKK
jgi:hypothetical protein